MALSPEVLAEINRRAKKIESDHARKILGEEQAEIKSQERKLNIRKNLSALNAQISADDKLRQSISTVLRENKEYKYFHNVTGLHSIFGVPIVTRSNQTAVFTPDGVIIIERHTEARWSSGAGHYSEDYFVPLKLKDADVEELFPNLGTTTTLNGSSQILKSLLLSPNKK
jgi:hypothetical protein